MKTTIQTPFDEAARAALEAPAAPPSLWPLDPQVIFLNHGSFGSCPRVVLEAQADWRARMERQPVQFFVRDLEPLWDEARAALASFVGAPAQDLVFVPNATAGLNTVLRSLAFDSGDELLVTNHEYNASRNALEFAAKRARARVVVADLPMPVTNSEQWVEALMACVTPRTRLAMLDHVTSQTGLILPLEAMVARLHECGVEVLVDGAHAPGMIPLNLESLGVSYYTANAHKWLCAPKGAAFLYVRRDRQDLVRPLVISHGANSRRTDRSSFLIEFGWTGTGDPSAALCVPQALRYMASLMPEGWPGIMARNHQLALAARDLLAQTLGVTAPAPDSMIGSLVALPLADAESDAPSHSPLYLDPLQDKLLAEWKIEVPVIPWPARPRRWVRVSAQLYNALPQYRTLARALQAALGR